MKSLLNQKDFKDDDKENSSEEENNNDISIVTDLDQKNFADLFQKKEVKLL